MASVAPRGKKRGKSVTILGTDRGTNWEQNTLEQGATVVALWIEPPICFCVVTSFSEYAEDG